MEDMNYNATEQNTNETYETPIMKQTKKAKKKNGVATALLVAVPCVAVCGLTATVLAAGTYITVKAIRGTKVVDKTPATLSYGENSDSSSSDATASNANNSTDATLASSSQVSTTTISTTGYADYADIVEETLPSVVCIKTTIDVSYSQFGQNFQGGQGTGSGSGVIVSKDDENLYIVTNNHVVSADSTQSSSGYSYYSFSTTTKITAMTVTFSDDTTVDASLRGTDEEHDLAVISVPLKELSSETLDTIRIASIGNSDEVRLGETAIAIGNALGYGQSVTQGIISAKNREVTFSDGYTRTLMQTDAAINPGNSGGGLFNAKGELIGINSAKYSDTDVEGVGYAIPVSDVTDLIVDLINYEQRETLSEDQQGFLGVGGLDITTDLASAYDMPKGVYVTTVVEGSPAEAAGLQLKDIITAVNDQSITSREELFDTIKTYAAGETVTVKIYRLIDGKYQEMSIEATLVNRSDVETSTNQSTPGRK